MVRNHPEKPFFRFIDDDGSEQVCTYEEAKIHAAGLALALKRRGIGPRSNVAVDMANCPAFIFAILAAAYGEFTLVVLNHRLTSFEKDSRLQDLKITSGIETSYTLTRRGVATLLDRALDFENAPDVMRASDSGPIRSRESVEPRWGKPKGRLVQRRQNGRYIVDEESLGMRDRADDAGTPLALNEIIHFAERARAAYTHDKRALIMFTSGTSGKPKAVPLTWENICSSAGISNNTLSTADEGCWQAALPLFHIGGFQVVVRSIMNRTPFLLYRAFNARRILDDAVRHRVTHISVVNKMLQDMLEADTRKTMHNYVCILLGGAAFNGAVLKQAVAAQVRVFASYGMTETSSQVAHSLVHANFSGELRLLPHYEVRIVNADEQGFGQLSIRGPGVFSGYLNSKTGRTVDGFFLTGDTAAYRDGFLVVRERTADMFVSGGENVYPAEIQSVLLRHPAISDAFVFGTDDATWGKRPVAFVERKKNAAEEPAVSLQKTSEQIVRDIEGSLSKLYRPKHLFVLDEFPRTGIGKVNRTALKQWYDQRIEVQKVKVYRVDQPFVAPITNAKETLESRESLIIEVTDWKGRTGISECVAFSTDWYLPETLAQDMQVLENHLIPLVLSQVYLHPSEVSVCLDECGAAALLPLAKGALEPALWDLYGKIVEQPLWKLIGGTPKDEAPGQMRLNIKEQGDQHVSSQSLFVRGGVALGIMPIDETLDTVQKYVAAGYRRIKLKIKPGDDVDRVLRVRQTFPSVTLVLDANQSYTERDIDRLQALDKMGAHCIEEPLDPGDHSSASSPNILARLSNLQHTMTTAICLDESLQTPRDYLRALDLPNLRCFTLKIAKLGGIQPALAFYRYAHQVGIDIWMGGMFETSVSKRMHAAFETLPGIDLPGDLSETARYFHQDIARPELTVERGSILLNSAGHEYGLGCELDYQALEKVLVSVREFTR